MIVRELLTKLGFDADEKKVQSFDAAIGTLTKSLAAVVGAASAAAAGALKMAMDTAAYGDEVAKTSRLIGIEAEELQGLRFAFDRMGVSAGEATGAMEFLNRKMGEAGETRSMAELLPELAEQLSGMSSQAEKAAFATEYFGRSGGRMVLALEAGGDNIRDLVSEFESLSGGLSGKDAEAAEVFTDQLTNMRAVMNGLRLQIGAKLMPIFGDLIDRFTDFMVVNREIIKVRIQRFFEVAIGIFRTTVSVIERLWSWADKLAQVLGGWENILKIVGIAFTVFIGLKAVGAVTMLITAVKALSVAMIANPAGLMVAAIVALGVAIALVIEDLWRWSKGHDSIFGKFFGDFDAFKGKVMETWAAIKAGFIDPMMHYMSAIRDVIVGAFTLDWDMVKGGFETILSGVGNLASNLGKMIFDNIMAALPDWVISALEKGGSALSIAADTMGGFADSASGMLSGLNPFRSAQDDVASGPSGGNTITDNRTVSIQVPPGSTEEQVKYIEKAVERSMSSQINSAALAMEGY